MDRDDLHNFGGGTDGLVSRNGLDLRRCRQSRYYVLRRHYLAVAMAAALSSRSRHKFTRWQRLRLGHCTEPTSIHLRTCSPLLALSYLVTD